MIIVNFFSNNIFFKKLLKKQCNRIFLINGRSAQLCKVSGRGISVVFASVQPCLPCHSQGLTWFRVIVGLSSLFSLSPLSSPCSFACVCLSLSFSLLCSCCIVLLSFRFSLSSVSSLRFLCCLRSSLDSSALPLSHL